MVAGATCVVRTWRRRFLAPSPTLRASDTAPGHQSRCGGQQLPGQRGGEGDVGRAWWKSSTKLDPDAPDGCFDGTDDDRRHPGGGERVERAPRIGLRQRG